LGLVQLIAHEKWFSSFSTGEKYLARGVRESPSFGHLPF